MSPGLFLKGPIRPSILFHLPFILLDSRTSYLLISLLTLAAFLLTTLVLPGLIQSTKWTPAIVAIFFTGLFSYGFQFEVERGQVNLFAVSCALASVWIFHRRPRLRWLAYLLFSAAAQLKVYPVIFIVNLVDDWRDWKAILKRFVGLGLLNFALLFLLGIDNFFRFFGGLSSMVVSENAASQNHSIGSYVGLLVEKLPSLSGYSSYLVNAFLALVLFCLVLIGYQAYRNRLTGLNPLFLLACAVAAQLIPRVSFDYTLSILPAAMAFFMAGADKIRKSVFSSAALLVICAAYGSTLFSNTYKYAAKELMPVLALFSNNFPALILILVAVASLSFSLLPGQETPPQRSLETYE
jgi:hypothetical protein